MKKVNYLFALCFFSFVLLIGCDNDDEPAPIEITVTGIPTITINENPENGDVLTTLEGKVNRGNLTFSLSNQNPAGAMAVNATTGELTVADASKFDFEINETITATGNVEAEGITKSTTITIRLNNLPETVTAPNATFSISENPNNGDLIGTIAGTTDAGTLTYEPADGTKLPNAITLGADGKVTVSVASLFDFEVRQKIEFDYQVTNGVDTKTGMVTINITDLDERPVQTRLDGGETPAQIVASGVTVDSLYAKTYGGGIIGSYTNGTVVVVGTTVVAENRGQNSARNIANSYVANGFSDWRLPSFNEANNICSGIRNDIRSLYPNSPNSNLFWTSTNCGGICFQAFSFGTGSCGSGGVPSNSSADAIVVRVSN